MKKLIIAACAVMLGIAANAAAVTWSVTSITDSPDVAKDGGWAVYVMDASTYTAFSALDGDAVAAYASANKVYQGTTASGRSGVGAAIKDGSYDPGDTVSSYMVIFNNANAADATYYAYTGTGSATISAGGADGTISFGTFTSATSGWLSTAGSTPPTPGPGDIPEPTSGLLLALGGAMLALRRRR